MSDRQNDVLAAIDVETVKCICGRPVPDDGPSLDYCSPECQYGHAGPRGSHRLGHGIPDGRTLNELVARSLTNTIPIGEHYQDAMHSDASNRRWTSPDEQAYRVAWVPPIANPDAPTVAELNAGIDLTPYIVAFEDTAWAATADPRPEVPCRVYWGSHGCKLERGHRGPHRCDPDCPPIDLRYEPYGEDAGPDQFRHRALAARQNRGTGPARRDNRRWRNR